MTYGLLALERRRARDAAADDRAEPPPREAAASDPAGRAPRTPTLPQTTVAPRPPRVPERLHLTEQSDAAIERAQKLGHAPSGSNGIGLEFGAGPRGPVCLAQLSGPRS